MAGNNFIHKLTQLNDLNRTIWSIATNQQASESSLGEGDE